MANNFSIYLKNKMLDKAVGAANFTPAPTLWIRLFSTVLTATGAGTELSNPSYQPIGIPNDAATFPLAANGTKSNAVRFDFAAAAENWANILSVGLFDSETGGNLYFYNNLNAPITIEAAQSLYFETGDLAFEIQ